MGGIKDIVIENKTALLSAPSDEETFINNMISLINNAEIRKKMSNAGKEFMLSNYHYLNLVENTKELYYKLLQEKNIIRKTTIFV